MPKSVVTYPAIGASELVFGLVYGSGAETELFQSILADSLRRYGYALRTIHLSNYFPTILGRDFNRDRPDATRELQDMGDELRRATGENAVLAQLASFLIAASRPRDAKDDRRIAWLIRSFKRPEEIETLRQIYGTRFILIGLYVPESIRQKNVEERWQRWSNVTSNQYQDEATRDIRRDERDLAADYGQAVRDTFSQADLFVDGRNKAQLQESLPRAIRLVFGEPFEPPHRDEQAMYHAYAAGLRSAEMGRQVGAAITDRFGAVLAVGTNEVPRAGGGLYWSPAHSDGRDFAHQPPLDSNTLWQRRISRELLVAMANTGWLNKRRVTELEGGACDVDEERLDKFLGDVKPTRFRALTEFGRAVHAEMDAITTAARNGIAIHGATLACTTFPCHNCIRHLIAAGIERVVYIHPYAKSLAADLHHDALLIEPDQTGPVDGKVVLEQYIGIAPRCYPQYFHFGEGDRKDSHGRGMQSPSRNATPRVLESGGAFAFGGPTFPNLRTVELEGNVVSAFRRTIQRRKALSLPIPSTEEDES